MSPASKIDHMRKALIVIDVQKGFVNSRTKKIIGNIKNYIKKHSKNYEVVVYTKYYNHKSSNFVKHLDWHGFMDKKQTDFVDEIVEFTNNKNVFIKDTYGSFVDNKLMNFLKKHKIQQVELAGFDTENCVLTFARDAFDRGFSVVVYKDLTASHSMPKLHRAALEIIENNIGEVK